METTLIQVKKETAEKLKRIKEYGRQSYDEIINKLLEANEPEVLTEKDIYDIKRGLEDIRAGRTVSLEKAAKSLGIRLKG